MRIDRKILLLCAVLCACGCAKKATPVEPGVFLTQLQPRDSILIGDQLEYGFCLTGVADDTQLLLSQVNGMLDEDVELVRDWKVDTLSTKKAGKSLPVLRDLKASVVLTSFEDGIYELPALAAVTSSADGSTDTLVFDPKFIDVKDVQIDTATFVVHEIKGQIRYPVTVREVLPWVAEALAGLALIAGIIILVVWLVRRRKHTENRQKEPAHIVALRKLDALRGDRLWAPEKQKLFYSGVTDALREYIDSRYSISAMEMTTAEIMDALKGSNLTPEMYAQLQNLFERADFVKFAKHVASEEENASVVPMAVHFVTETYQKEIENETETR